MKRVQITIGLLLLALAASLAGNFFLFHMGKQYYLALQYTRLHPLGLNTFTTTPPKEDDMKTVVFFGDSRAKAWTFPHMADFQFINRGINGQTSPQVSQRYPAHIAPLNPDILIVQVCINDLKTIPLFPTRQAEIIAACQTNLQAIVQQAQAQNTIVILTTIFPVGKIPLQRQPFWSEEVDIAIREVNTFIHSLASPHVIILDAFTLLANEKGKLQPHYALDELHINQQAYEQLNQALIPLLQSRP